MDFLVSADRDRLLWTGEHMLCFNSSCPDNSSLSRCPGVSTDPVVAAEGYWGCVSLTEESVVSWCTYCCVGWGLEGEEEGEEEGEVGAGGEV